MYDQGWLCALKKKKHIFCYDLIQRILLGNWEGKHYDYGAPEEAVDGWFLFLTPGCALQSVDEMG